MIYITTVLAICLCGATLDTVASIKRFGWRDKTTYTMIVLTALIGVAVVTAVKIY